MPSALEVGIVAQRELLRNLRSTKGIAMFVLFLLGGVVPAVVRMMFAKLAGGDVPDAVLRAGFETILARRHGEVVAKYLVDAPPVAYLLFQGTLTFLPMFVLVIGFDQIAGEVQHRTIRYSAGRAKRGSIVVGKALEKDGQSVASPAQWNAQQDASAPMMSPSKIACRNGAVCSAGRVRFGRP